MNGNTIRDILMEKIMNHVRDARERLANVLATTDAFACHECDAEDIAQAIDNLIGAHINAMFDAQRLAAKSVSESPTP